MRRRLGVWGRVGAAFDDEGAGTSSLSPTAFRLGFSSTPTRAKPLLTPHDVKRPGFGLGRPNCGLADRRASGVVKCALVRLRHLAIGHVSIPGGRASVNTEARAYWKKMLLNSSFQVFASYFEKST